MIKWLFLSLLVLILGTGGWWFLKDQNDFQDVVSSYLDNGEFQTLEAHYLPQQIMDEHYEELLGDDQHHFLESTNKYHPYVLMEVKFLADKKTREGVILWSLINGEMVLNTDTWEQTHGFEDAIKAKASPDEFKIMNVLAKNQGTRSKEELITDLQLDGQVILPWIESALQKNLIVRKGNYLQLHFENPKILVLPQTKFNRMLVTKPYSYSQQVAEKYSTAQIEKIARAAFGESFSIGNMSKVYLPIYGINVENPDGSTSTTFWNAVNGQRINPKYYR